MTAHPYRDAAADYFVAGWSPLPVRGKWPPPKGWTGTDGRRPSFADVYAWAEGAEGELNIGLRMPAHVLGIDVDQYGTKRGGETLREHEERLGPLPATWTSTSRSDGVSGIRLFVVPEGMHWPGVLTSPSLGTADVDVIQERHRYVMAPPSIHPEGRPYVWLGPDSGTPTPPGVAPHVDDLPNLPQPWIDALTGGRTAADIARAELGDAQASLWLVEHGAGTPCPHMVRAIDRAERELDAGASRHDAAMRATARIGRMVAEGHKGALAALEQIRAAFDRSIGSARTTSGEWQRLIAGAVRIAAVDPVQPVDPCTIPGHPDGFGNPVQLSPFTAPNVFGPAPFGALAPQIREQPWTSPTISASSDADAMIAPLTDTLASPQAATSASGAEPTSSVAETRSSWRPIDLSRILSGEFEQERPVVLVRNDGEAMFYLGRVNGLIGPSESGKTLVALEACKQELLNGYAVAYVDFEDTAPGIVHRLLAYGVPAATLLERFAYIGPDEAPGPGQMAEFVAALDEQRPRLVVLDGFNAAMALAGLEVNSNTDATRFHQALLRPITAHDRAVVYIDHTVKAKDDASSGGIGAQAKRAMTTGCALRVDKKDDFGPGTTGYLKLLVDKDRMGMVRQFAAGAKWAGEAIVESDEDGRISITLQPYDPDRVREQVVERRGEDLRGQVCAWLLEHGGAMSQRGIEAGVKGRSADVREALAALETAGFISSNGVQQRGKARLYRAHRPYVTPAQSTLSAFQPSLSTGSSTSASSASRVRPGNRDALAEVSASDRVPDPYVVGAGPDAPHGVTDEVPNVYDRLEAGRTSDAVAETITETITETGTDQ